MSSSFKPPLNTKEGLQGWLLSKLAERGRTDRQAIDIRESFSRHGLDSMGATRLLGELAEILGRPLSPVLAWQYPTIESLAAHLVAGTENDSPAPASAPSVTGYYEPIAVVGMACRFPKAPDLDAFWRLLRHGVDAITEVPKDRNLLVVHS